MKNVEPIFINKNSKVGVLMLHGFSSTPRQFKKLSIFLADKGLNVSAPIIAGHGTTPDDFIKTCSKDWTKSSMEAYRELKKISEKVFIIGNSFGSNLGLWLVKELDNEPEGIIVLGAPIFLRFHNLIKLRLFTYGRFRKFYKKPVKYKKADNTDVVDEISYPVMPIKNLNEFIKFLERETRPNLHKIETPILIVSADSDPLIHPRSVNYIFKKIKSPKKEIIWFDSRKHDIVTGGSEELFSKIYGFIKEYV